LSRDDVLVLCYHAVSERWPDQIATPPERLERQVAGLLRRGYVPVTFRRAVLDPPARRTLAVTFDDAYRSVIEQALPVLAALEAPASVYAPTAFVGSERPMSWPGIEQWVGGPHERELRPMGWPELGELAQAGWEIGSHSVTHPKLTRIGPEALAGELRESRAEIERRLGGRCDTLAYPFGDVNAAVIEAAAQAGYAAAGSVSSLRAVSPLDWPRVGVWREDSAWRFRLKTAASVRRRRTSDAAPYPDGTPPSR